MWFVFLFVLFCVLKTSLTCFGCWKLFLCRIRRCRNCRSFVWTKLTDCSPAGPNPLHIHVCASSYTCRQCGEYYHSVD